MKISSCNIAKLYNKVHYVYKIKEIQLLSKYSNKYKGKIIMINEVQLNRKRQNEGKNGGTNDEGSDSESYEINKKTKLIPKLKEENFSQNNLVSNYFTSNVKGIGNSLKVYIEKASSTEETIKIKSNETEMDEKENKKIYYKKEENEDSLAISKVEGVNIKSDDNIYNEHTKYVHEEGNNVNKTVLIKENKSNDLEAKGEEQVKIVVTWNMNSITVRYKNKEKWKNFMNFFNKINADVWCLQEVRLPAMNIGDSKNENKNKNKNDGLRDRSKVKNSDQKSLVDYEIIDSILKNDFKNYDAYFSLANIKYSGQLVLIKKTIQVKSIRYNLSFDMDSKIHHDEGRIILVEFSDFYLLSTYSPNNGFDKIKFERRRLFDEELEKFVSYLKNKKHLIWTGDLNIAPEDIDLSHPAEFRKMKKGNNVPKEFIGQPGCTDFERKNFKKILTSGDLVDSYRYLQNLKEKNAETESSKNPIDVSKKSNINDNIYTWRCPFLLGKQSNKAMRIDHFIVSKNFLNRVDNVEIHGYSVFHNNFYGSDHCPVILYLKGEE
ncbi:DNA-(apurinic or apyrimidinic site) lyase [Plasmodium brasilianum]|uniref:DNA-(apurinic or apyrimidinic site) endonuclease n=2 Tax=Plasmodium (Plasmodium) TaxID=418103 RepID=A0A1A8VZ50_PLAMA|nr:AP endonuclease (DNA-[apurinic or apyrimidinic site] lyase), putative [Plasmodium malariae]KAI4839024.1 DNA-(apurinic or apyrimidinic site) lyase [Plasmodium brasilianum]SBS84980.1 AP endonuclease (DNA-[apurinic or apyrimidinic site] lyase), putative [Plasmodium malariae]SCN12376.1 AP endonuclease (DNA-[apurinic or apyrimidinic site] lyase), putative [Plasmodium malariae]